MSGICPQQTCILEGIKRLATIDDVSDLKDIQQTLPLSNIKATVPATTQRMHLCEVGQRYIEFMFLPGRSVEVVPLS